MASNNGHGRRIRIGIDVGGTFTDAVAIDADSLELIGQVKIPTTHRAAEGVARGIIDALHQLLAELQVSASDVSFIAHGTTQATNALLEGDVATVGIVGLGAGLEGLRARGLTVIDPIELAPGKFLTSYHRFISTGDLTPEVAEGAINSLVGEGAQTIVATAPFSVDDPTDEEKIVETAIGAGIPAAGAHEISKLYGLKTRTRTAVVNASILPRMLDTANMTEASVERAGIRAPLMVMRCDGGVMDIAQVRRRPILTILSGPAAGVAGALMYERISNGIFLEVGGTSTDISAVRDGRVIVKYATIGGHRTYLNSLDVRTIGVAGGSLIRVRDGKLVDVGPRSAHIADLEYAVYQAPTATAGARLVAIQPRPTDPDDYVAVDCAGGRFALTVTCAANVLGTVNQGDYAKGNVEAARNAFVPLAEALGLSVEDAARRVLEKAAERLEPTIRDLIKEYDLADRGLVLVGGGGGAAAVVPFLAQQLKVPHQIARNAQVISPIGVALALVRDTVERTIPNATPADLLRVRQEAEAAAVAAGANPATIEVDVSVDPQRNVVRAVAIGATELRTRDLREREVSEEARRAAAAESLNLQPAVLTVAAQTPYFTVFQAEVKKSGFLGRFARTKHPARVVDSEGILRLQLADAQVSTTTGHETPTMLRQVVDAQTTYNDSGAMLPAVYLLVRGKVVSLAGVVRPEQIYTLAESEIRGSDGDGPIVIIAERRE